MFWRTTDVFIQQKLKKTPLDLGADRIARTAYAALAVLGSLRAELGISIPLAWTPGTDGVISAEPVFAPIHSKADFDKYHGKLKGKAVLMFDPPQLRLHPGEAYRRLNWGLQLDDRPDLSLDAFGAWGPRRAALDVVDPGREVHLRTEVQHVVKLPLTGSVLFLIGVRLLPLERVARIPEWAARLASVLETLTPETASYKELDELGPIASTWLRGQAPT